MKNFLNFYFVLCVSTVYAATLTPQFQWKYIEYEWDSDEQKQDAIDSGAYNISASNLADVDIANDQRVFVTIVRTAGVPATLGIVSEKNASEESGGPLIRPYPDWSTNLNNDCDGFTNIYQVAIDECNQLWALDTGVIDLEYKCPAKLVVFDLKSDSIIKQVEIPRDLYTGILVTIIIHNVDPQCKKPSVYMADVFGNGLVIYDSEENFCRLEADEFNPDPDATSFTIGGEKATLEVGLLGMALTAFDDEVPDDERTLYFRPLSSYAMYSVLADEIRDYCNTKTAPNIVREKYSMASQSTAFTIADDVLFFGYLDGSALKCWDTYKPFTSKNIGTVSQDAEQLQVIHGIKTFPKKVSDSQNVILLTTQHSGIGDLNVDIMKVNFRIFNFNAYVTTYGTECGP